jgi:hypothetical protein
MGAADLGSAISVVEPRLSDTLLRCVAWNAVLLIDEADVFLEARVKVLANFLDTLPRDSVEVSREEVEELMARPMNGRQIKSAVKTARILAQSEGEKLGKEYLKLVLGLREKAQTLMG